MVVFDHEKLEVDRIAVQYADATDSIAAKLKRPCSRSTPAGAGEFEPAEKARFYRIALRSRRTLADLESVENARLLLKRVVEMLTRLVQSVGRRSDRDRV